MSLNLNISVANSGQIAQALGERLSLIRLSQNRTQEQVASEAGVSRATLVRLEQGQNTSLDTLIRVMMALKLGEHLEHFLPDPSIRPLERVALAGRERQRARPKKKTKEVDEWAWGDDT